VDKLTNTEFSTDRSTHKTELGFQQVGAIKQEYVNKENINTHKEKGVDIKYYTFSNTIRVHYEYTTPLGAGSGVVKRLNDSGSSFQKTRLKGGKSNYKGLLNEILNLFKKK